MLYLLFIQTLRLTVDSQHQDKLDPGPKSSHFVDKTCKPKHLQKFLKVLAGEGGGGVPRGLGHNLLMQFSSLCGSKMEVSETDFFYIVTIYNDQISHVKHVLDPIHVLFTLFGCMNGSKGLGHNLPMQFCTLGSSND